jgi:Rrf2 family protein
VVPTLRRRRSSGGNAVLSISARVDYAVQVLCALAESNKIMTARQLSVSLGLPHKFLEAILTDLHRGAVLTSRRGAGGGFGLARPADEMSLGEVITSLVGAVAEVRGQVPEAIDYRGPAEHLRTAWLAVRSNLRFTLEGITIADIVRGDLGSIAVPSPGSRASQAVAVGGVPVGASASVSAKSDDRYFGDADDSTDGRPLDTSHTLEVEESAAPAGR